MPPPARPSLALLLAHRPTPSRVARPALSAAAAPARCINITATAPSSSDPSLESQIQANPSATPSLDARFEVVGSPFSLLSVSLAASQHLYTRRGTLVGLSGKAENTLSTLSVLGPLRRAPVGIPFLYQKVSSTSPITALISTKSPISSIVTINIDGRQDWLISQRNALLAWTGHTLHLSPRYNVKLGVNHWGNTHVTGRGLLALAGSGQIYQVQLKAGESYIAHPSNVLAYTAATNPPSPFRFKSSSIRFQIPNLGFTSLLQNVKFFKDVSESQAWKVMTTWLHTAKTWVRRSVWGDRLFLHFEGPTTMLLQSRGSRIGDVLTLRDVDEIADSPPGAVQDAVARKIREEIKEIKPSAATSSPVTSGPTTPSSTAPTSTPIASQSKPEATTTVHATVKDGKAEFEKKI
ncbi:mitochondrial biogenesis AIM24-domain-containing protein [Clohesyomyces aquaticus]|uniref:Altered inheritance of mitochondria protein 24, mitochondrial n=1 Tax=Clohesyomyces aquaticus TaxID=1231657 RepID=A0A1Y1ZQT2_9PLEO|nr:mitochondrial biogenesis AIM24-domain-containing protein [Clohesyomyces aquaticus]